MALYSYTGMTPDGKHLNGSLRADDPDDLKDRLWRQNLFLVSWHVYGQEPSDYPAGGILLWIATHTGGAVTTKKHARLVLLFSLALVLGTAVHLVIACRPRPSVLSPFMRAEMQGKRMPRLR